MFSEEFCNYLGWDLGIIDIWGQTVFFEGAVLCVVSDSAAPWSLPNSFPEALPTDCDTPTCLCGISPNRTGAPKCGATQ